MGHGVTHALARQLRGTETAEEFARRAHQALAEEFGVVHLELTHSDDGAELRAHPDVVPEDVAVSIAELWLVAHRLERLAHDASHDALTGLANRRAFDTKLAQAVAGAERYGWAFALVLLDLDGLKAINDEFGHSVGDDVLRTFGRELTHSVRVEDVAARLGGDEFGLVVMGADNQRVVELLERVTGLVNRALNGIHVTVSSGVTLVPADGTDAAALYRLADERLYRSKRG